MDVNQEERAAKAWNVLSKVAADKDLITYGQLGRAIGVHHRAVRYVLGVIQTYCMDNKLPPMTILVVNQISKNPGEGFVAWDADDIETGLRKVYAKDWVGDGNPLSYALTGLSEEELAARLVEKPSSAGETFRLVKDRGIAQRIFSAALFKVYDGACAFCGLTFDDALQGAHIVHWSVADAQQRMAPNNGLLLCATHHQLFDAGLMVVDPFGKIFFYDMRGEDGPYSEADRAVSIALHGTPVRVPKDIRHKPLKEHWSWRYKEYEWGVAPWRFT